MNTQPLTHTVIQGILNRITELGISLSVVGNDDLRIKAPNKRVVTPEIKEIIKAHKAELIAYLTANSSAIESGPEPTIVTSSIAPVPSVNNERYEAAIQLVQRLKHVGIGVKLEDGRMIIDSEETVSKRVGDTLLQYEAEIVAWLGQDAELCCRCGAIAQHTSPSGNHYCNEHNMCIRGHQVQWKYHEQLDRWLCACFFEQEERLVSVQAVGDGITEQERAILAHLSKWFDVQFSETPCATCFCRIQVNALGSWECANCNPNNGWSDATIAKIKATMRKVIDSHLVPLEEYAAQGVRDQLLALGAEHGYPRWKVSDWQAIASGEASWRLYAESHGLKELQQALMGKREDKPYGGLVELKKAEEHSGND